MGLLDDAIREHLELKRKRGGDPSEIDRQESEALGPVRRTADETELPEAAAPPAGDVAIAEPEPEALVPDDEPLVVDEVEAAEVEAPPAEPPLEPEPAPLPEPVAEAPEPAAEEALPDHLAQPTVEFSVEEHLAGGDADPDVVVPDEEAEDVLEETPDFLQETPEHDRLWFEQKPPRDFDFDG